MGHNYYSGFKERRSNHKLQQSKGSKTFFYQPSFISCLICCVDLVPSPSWRALEAFAKSPPARTPSVQWSEVSASISNRNATSKVNEACKLEWFQIPSAPVHTRVDTERSSVGSPRSAPPSPPSRGMVCVIIKEGHNFWRI